MIPLEFFHSTLVMLSNAKSILVLFFFNVLQISSTFLNPGDEMCICCGDGSVLAGRTIPCCRIKHCDSGPNLRNTTPYQITLCHAKIND